MTALAASIGCTAGGTTLHPMAKTARLQLLRGYLSLQSFADTGCSACGGPSNSTRVCHARIRTPPQEPHLRLRRGLPGTASTPHQPWLPRCLRLSPQHPARSITHVQLRPDTGRYSDGRANVARARDFVILHALMGSAAWPRLQVQKPCCCRATLNLDRDESS